MDLAVHHVCVTVTDLGRSLAFYEALGFRRVATLGPPDGSRTIVQLALGDGMVELLSYRDGVSPMAAPAGPVAGLRHIGLSTGDVRATLAELEKAGLIEPGVPVSETGTGITMAFFEDPDGTSIELLSAG
jgi:catechol 2,3-dioxygenase-like lactoylglutathione lyase family enzyme